MRAFALLLGLFVLTGCDKLTGAADQKIADAEAIGFACRVSGKTPEACMKENEAQPPSSILDGWKSADEDIKAGKLDPGMSNTATAKPEGEAAAAEGESKPAGDKPATDKPAEDAGKKEEKPAGDKAPAAEDKKDAKADTKHEPEATKKPAEAEPAKKAAESKDKPAH